MRQMRRRQRTRSRAPDPVESRRRVVLTSLFVFVALDHDVALGAGYFRNTPFDFVFLLYLVPVLVASVGVYQIARFSSALRRAETLNRELEDRVADKQAKLERSFERLRALEAQRAVAGERERIMRDIHDGLGGQLVSMLSQVERDDYRREDLLQGLRSSLDELRMTIDSLDPNDDDLVVTLATLRSRLPRDRHRCGRNPHHTPPAAVMNSPPRSARAELEKGKSRLGASWEMRARIRELPHPKSRRGVSRQEATR